MYQQYISKVSIKIPRGKIRKVFTINCFITSGIIYIIKVYFEGKL